MSLNYDMIQYTMYDFLSVHGNCSNI